MKISRDTLIVDIINRYPEVVDVFIHNGFAQFKDPEKLKLLGRLRLETALAMKGLNVDAFLKLLNEIVVEKAGSDVTLKSQVAGDMSIVGVLPCPVRVPLLEMFDRFRSVFERKYGTTVSCRLEAASVGVEWMEEMFDRLDSADDLPDVFISAGFEMFFSRDKFGRFKDEGVFSDITGDSVNKDFADLDIKDPMKHYSVISVIPTVFMVNTSLLGGLPVPRSWEELLDSKYEGKVAIPVGDFDMFNAMLVNIYKDFGREGIEKFARLLYRSMHPSDAIRNRGAAISLIPFFFTRMNRDVLNIKYVWPEDGAIISPVFMLVKKDRLGLSKELAGFFYSRETGRIFAHGGLFPSLHPDVKNILPDNATFKWPGWDYIYSNDVSSLISDLKCLFVNVLGEGI